MILRLQHMLARMGYEPGRLDGQIGPRTRAAIRAAEQAAGVRQTGQPSGVIVADLDRRLARLIGGIDWLQMEDMQKIAVSVEANLLTKRARAKAEKKVTVKEESSSVDQLLQKVEKILERVKLDKPEPQVRNPNFRGQQQPQYRIR